MLRGWAVAQTEEIGASQSVNVGRKLRLTNSYKRGDCFTLKLKKGSFGTMLMLKFFAFFPV